MSEFWHSTLFLPNLPKELTSRRNLLAHFSEYGKVDNVSVNKADRTGLVKFLTHAEAKTAKVHGKIYGEKSLKIFWSDNSEEASKKTLDPRAREIDVVPDIDTLYEDDDKECFGVESKPTFKDESNKTTKDIMKDLKERYVKRRLGSSLKNSEENKSESSEIKIPNKLSKSQPKVYQFKKTLSNKRKLSREEGISAKKKVSLVYSKPNNDRTVDLKQKLSLLDQRDKIIREKSVLHSDIKIAVAFKGTCLDMCPERERISRQYTHDSAVYECFPGTNDMDESKAVKAYTRSSADQHAPLPHELRPGPVLSLTMNYLITNIINKLDDPNENKEMCYSFCCNRLRSIRKDIIVQQLCNLETVNIIEQCTRFHIICYDHMWGMEVSGYNDKFNTNNLMDCLQTLLHQYEDLAKHNIKCPNEAEFKSYLILVKLNTGDVFWEYQQYAPEIQLSPKVQFAIEAYMAILNNMYSKYFSLVKQASYLEACLMQRHFDQVRKKALKVMLKAYSLRSKNVTLTPFFLKECLKFDSLKNVITFCKKAEGNLDKKIKYDPEEIEDEDIVTSSYLIQDKRLPIANAVVGEHNPLPIYEPRLVHTSFDEDGRLRESTQSVPDDSFNSFDSPVDESDVSVGEVEPQSVSRTRPFKFLLSPIEKKENVFSKNIFSRLGQFSTDQGSLVSTESSEGSTKLENSNITIEGCDSLYEYDEMDSIKMEEDIYEDKVYDEGCDENPKETIYEKNVTPFNQETAEERSTFGFNQPFSNTPLVPTLSANASSSLFQMKENQPMGYFPNVISPKFIRKESSKSSQPIALQESAKQFSSKPISSENSPFQQVTLQIKSQNCKTTHFFGPHSEMKPKVDDSCGSLVIPENVEKTLEIKREERRKEEKQNILQMLLLKKEAEEERIKMEEAKLAELERQKKKIEEQKALMLLRKDLCQRMKAKNARKYARIWKARVEKLKEKRADFPMLHALSVESHIKLWGKITSFPTTSVYQRAKDKHKLNLIVSQLLKNGVTDSCRYVGRDLAELLAKSAARTLGAGSVRPVYWKLAMSLPWMDRSTSQFCVFNQMMRRCCKQTFYKEADAQLSSVESTMTSLHIPVHVSVHFSDDSQSCGGLQGMDALIFVVVDGFETEKTCLDRLRSLVSSQATSSQISVSVMTINGTKFDRVLKIELKELHEQSLIAYWSVSAWKTSDCLLENLAFLAEHVNVVQDVCARSLESLVREAVDDFIYDVDKSQVYCPTLTNALECPNSVIRIYNTFLTKLEDLLLSSKLEKYFNFAEEFQAHVLPNECGGPELMCGKQYNNQYKMQISNKINSLKLPEFPGWPDHTNKVDFDSMAALLETYCSTKINDMEVYKQVIRKLAQEVADPVSCVNSYSWLHIVEMWSESRLSRVFSTREKGRTMFVVYNKNDLQRMIKTQWWITLPIGSPASKKV